MKKTEILASIDGTFEKQVQQLAMDGIEIVHSYAAITNKMLLFASSFKSMSDHAQKLDRGTDGVHYQFLKITLADAVNTANASIWSRWNTIGTYSDQMLQFADSLPPQRDSLYELALAIKDKRPFKKWIESERITVESSVRDVRALRKPKNLTGTKRKDSSSVKMRHYNAMITLCFSSYDEAVNTLSELIAKNTKFELKSHHAFTEALKAKVGIDAFQKLKDRFR